MGFFSGVMSKNAAAKGNAGKAPVESVTEDGALIAVITAAVAAYLGETAGGFRIKSIKSSSAWRDAAKRERVY